LLFHISQRPKREEIRMSRCISKKTRKPNQEVHIVFPYT
jgi:hypothetical protein